MNILKSCLAILLLVSLLGVAVADKRPFGYCFYSALQVSKDATDADIQAAYLELSAEYPPVGETKEINDKIKEAYDILSNKKSKEIYDSKGMKGFEAWEKEQKEALTEEEELEALRAMLKKMKSKGIDQDDLLNMIDNPGQAATASNTGKPRRQEQMPKPRSGGAAQASVGADGRMSYGDQNRGQKDQKKDVQAGKKDERKGLLKDVHVSEQLWGDDNRPRNYDFYAALQLRKKATPEEIKAKYDQLVAKYPADSEGNNLEIHMKIEEANLVLTDTETKEIYDKYGMPGYEEWERGYKPREPANNAFIGMVINKMKANDMDDESIDEMLEIMADVADGKYDDEEDDFVDLDEDDDDQWPAPSME